MKILASQLLMFLAIPAFASPVFLVSIESMETLESLNISIDREWIVRDQKKSVSLSLVWQLQEFDRSKYDPEFLPHFSLINNDREADMPPRLRLTLIPDDQGKVEAIFQLAESEIAHTKLYFDFGSRPAFTLNLQDFINYFLEEPNAPNKTRRSSPDRTGSE